MTEYHPMYGTLLSSKEVSEITGHSLVQLRNFRQRPETSPFPFLKHGGTCRYREADIKAWLTKHGGLVMEYVVPPHVEPEPLTNPTFDHARKRYFDILAGITTNNAWGSKATWLLEQSGLQNPYRQVEAWAEQLWALYTGKPSAENGWKMLAKAKTEDPEMYWKATVFGVRKGYAEINKWDVTDQEIIEIPVGDVPPLKIT